MSLSDKKCHSAWHSLGSGVNGTSVNAVAVHHRGTLYAGGDFTQAGTGAALNIASWDGSAWHPLGPGLNASVHAIYCFGKGEIYAGGDFTHAGNVVVNHVARWNGERWFSLGDGLDGAVNALEMDSNGNLYVGGSFGYAGQIPASSIARWDGEIWSSLGEYGVFSHSYNFGTYLAKVHALEFDSEGSLFVGGRFDYADKKQVFNIVRWNGRSWNETGYGVDSSVKALLSCDGRLYVGGEFADAGGTFSGTPSEFQSVVSQWDGDTWHQIFYSNYYQIVDVVCDQNDTLYFASKTKNDWFFLPEKIQKWDGKLLESIPCDFYWSFFGHIDEMQTSNSGRILLKGEFRESIDFSSRFPFAFWDGNEWDHLSPINSSWGRIYSTIFEPNGENAVFGGSFSQIGGIPAINIARYNGDDWLWMGNDINDWVSSLTVDPSGYIIAGGGQVHKWKDGSWTTMGSLSCPVQTLINSPNGTIYARSYPPHSSVICNGGIYKWDGDMWQKKTSTEISSNLSLDYNENIYTLRDNWLYQLNGDELELLAQPNYEPGGYRGRIKNLVIDSENRLYISGNFSGINGVSARNIAMWDGVTWNALGSGIEYRIRDLEVDSQNNIYSVGDYYTEENIEVTSPQIRANNIAAWDGQRWGNLGSGFSGDVYSIAIDNNGLVIVGGAFTHIGNREFNHIACWDGTTWHSLGEGVNGCVRKIVIDSNNNIYVSGSFTRAGDTQSRWLAMWDGAEWQSIDTGIFNPLWSFTIDQHDNIFAGGQSSTYSLPQKYIVAKWDGGSWEKIGEWEGFYDPFGLTMSIVVDNQDQVYIGGEFREYSLKYTNLYKYDGTNWSDIGTVVGGGGPPDYRISDLAVDANGLLYAAGSFTTIRDVDANRIAVFNGVNWKPLGTGLNDMVHSITLDGEGNLYACGNFTTAGNVAANRVAVWDGESWRALGIGLNATVWTIAVDSQKTVSVGGKFNSAGGISSAYFGQWHPWKSLPSAGRETIGVNLR